MSPSMMASAIASSAMLSYHLSKSNWKVMMTDFSSYLSSNYANQASRALQAQVIEYEQNFLSEFLDGPLVCTFKSRLCQFVSKVISA